MPFYDYICPKCNTNEKRLVKAQASTLQDCRNMVASPGSSPDAPPELVECSTRLDRCFPTPNLKGKVEVDSKGRVWYGTGGCSSNLTKPD